MRDFNMITNFLCLYILHIVPPLFFIKIKVKAKIICEMIHVHFIVFLVTKLDKIF